MQQSLRPYPYYDTISVTTPRNGSSIYHSWLLNLEKRMSNGLVLLGSYTFGKLIDEPTSVTLPGQAGSEQVNAGSGYRLGRFNRHLDRSLDPTDSASRFVFSGIYELPFGSGKHWQAPNRVLQTVIGGWQFDAVLVTQNGLPLFIRGANNFLADRPNSTGKTANLPNPNRNEWFDVTQFVNPPSYTIGNVGRTLPDVRAPGLLNLDFSIIKNTKIRERFNLQFRAESFNMLNKVNLLEPNATFVPGANGLNSSSTFGTITGARDPRNVQLGLKLLF